MLKKKLDVISDKKLSRLVQNEKLFYKIKNLYEKEDIFISSY